MYLEISGRRSGKTTRLIKAVEDYLKSNPDRCATIVIYDKRQIKYYESRLDESIVGRVYIRTGMIGSNRCFVDEFDIIPKDRLILSETAYYVATPIKLRTLEELYDKKTEDFLAKLWFMNKGTYIHYSVEEHVSELIRMRKLLSEEEFRLMWGEFVKL